MNDKLPKSVRYIKNGAKGRWWRAAKANNQLHLGWRIIPSELLLKADLAKIEQLIRSEFGVKRGATQDFKALRDLLNNPSQHIWVTFEGGYLWWCTVGDGATVNPAGADHGMGHFWLSCVRPWSNQSLNGKPLAISDLPGTVTATAGFKGTVCQPTAWQTVIRIIRDEKDPDAMKAAAARRDYEQAMLHMVQRLSPKDFEQLIDLILSRSGWTRICKLGGVTEGIDEEVENLAAREIAFVQVKSSASQKVLDDYVGRFKEQRDRYARMIFAVHSPVGTLVPPAAFPAVQLWEGNRVAELAVRLGLGEWVEGRLA